MGRARFHLPALTHPAKSRKKQMSKEETKVTAYKGFSKDLKAHGGFQYEIGKTYKHEGVVEKCGSGFHASEYPLDVFSFFNPAQSRFALVEQSGTIDKGDDKNASSVIAVKAEISIGDMVKAAIDFTMSRVKKPAKKGLNDEENGLASNSGDCGAASNSGDYGAASNSGYCGAAFNAGYEASADTSGGGSVAVGVGYANKARAAQGDWIVLAYRPAYDKPIEHLKTAQAGVTEGVKADAWYKLDADGKFVEVV